MGRDEDGRRAWEEARRGVRPLPREERGRRASSAPPRPAPPAPEPEAVRFEVRLEGERHQGLAEGTDRRHLRRLRRGPVEIDARIDLHGARADEARARLLSLLRESHAAGRRTLLIVHGRGRSSEEGAVLRPRLRDWLTEPEPSRLVLAFASARPEDGGAGATYVLLRRSH